MAVLTITHPGAVATRVGFADFYRAERIALHRALALTLGDSDLAAEAVDEAMVRAYQRWRHISDYDSPAGWVYRVALNWAVSASRRRRRSIPVAAVVDTAATESAPIDDELAQAIAALPTQQRAVVVLRFHMDWSLEQIATALDVPAGTVKSRLHRALAALRTTLEVEL